MHDMTQQVRKIIPELEWQQFSEPDERERLMEIRGLALEQVEDDRGQHGRGKRDKVGRAFVDTYEWIGEQSDLLYPARTPDQFALEEGLQPLLESALTGEQRVLVRWRYGAMYTERQIAGLLNVTQPAVHYRLETIHRRLRDVLLSAFGPSGDLTEEV